MTVNIERMPEGLPSALSLHLPTDLVFVRPGRKMVEGLLYAQGWDEEDVEEAALVFTELLQNAIEHGSRKDGTERASVDLELSDGALDMAVADPGTGQAAAALLDRDVTVPVPLDVPRGRGLFLVNRLAASFERAEREEGGCLVRVRLETS